MHAAGEEGASVASLFVIQGRNRGQRFDLADDETSISIGRESANTVRLDDNEVSRRHAEIRRVGEQYVVGDLRSSNGTYVNSRKVERSPLASGDQIQVGRTVLVFGRESEDLPVGPVDIISGPAADEHSRIVRALPDETADLLLVADDTQNLRLARARSNLQVMYRTALAVSHTLDIDDLLGRILGLVFEWVEADRGCIMLLDPTTRQLTSKARRDRNGSDVTRSMTISRTILDYVLDRREGVLTSDARDDDRFRSGHSVLRTGVREAICVPMQGRYDTVGVIYVDTTVPLAAMTEAEQQRFTEEHLKLMIAIGHQAALAVEDTTYYSAMVQSERLAAVGQTIATLSHHIKNILQGIRGGSYLVDMGLEGSDPAVLKKGWDIVTRNQNKISSLVMDMLSFSKQREPEPVPSGLVGVIEEVIETVAQRATEAGSELIFRPPAVFPELLFDPEGISRAILNVVSNALDAIDERRQEEPACEKRVTVSLTAAPEEGLCRIVVDDTGNGMDEETAATVFNLFVSTKGSRGTGLGLTVSKKILQEHGGDITVTSRPGHGSRFILELPMTFPSEGFGQTLSSAAVPEDEADRDAGLDEDGPSS
jgi:two-component system NtrC family sensor kinase